MSTKLTITLSKPLADYLKYESKQYNITRQGIIYDSIIARIKHRQRTKPKYIYPTNRQYRTMRSYQEKIGEQIDELNKNLEDKAKATTTLLNYGLTDIKSPNEKAKIQKNQQTSKFFSSDMHKIFVKLNEISKLHQQLSRVMDSMAGYESHYPTKKAARKS